MPSKPNPLKCKAYWQNIKQRQTSQREGNTAHLAGFEQGQAIVESTLGRHPLAVPHNNAGVGIGDPVQLTRSNVPIFDWKPLPIVSEIIPEQLVDLLQEVEVLYFPWIGVTAAELDLIASALEPLEPQEVGLQCYGDRFLFSDPNNADEPGFIDQPYYVSCLNNDQFSVRQINVDSSAVVVADSLTAAQYLGATSFYGSAQVISAFENSSVIPWPRDRDPDPAFLGTNFYQGIPVGGQCFAPVALNYAENVTQGTLTPPPVDDPNGFFFLSSGINNAQCSYVLAFRDTFQLIHEHTQAAIDTVIPALAGQNLALYSLYRSGGQLSETREGQQSNFGIGQVVSGGVQSHTANNIWDGIVTGGFQNFLRGVLQTNLSVWGELDQAWRLVGSDNSGTYSDPEATDLIPPRTTATFSLVGSLPSAIGDPVSFTLISGGESGEAFRLRQHVATTAQGPTIRIEVHPIGAVTSGTEYLTNDALMAAIQQYYPDRIGYKMAYDPNGVGGTTAAQCTDPSVYSVPPYSDLHNWDGIFNHPTTGQHKVVIIEETPSPTDEYYYETNPILYPQSFVGQWVLVAEATGQRYFLDFNSSSISYPNINQGQQQTSPTIDLNGQQFNFVLQAAPEAITWDAVAGDVADLAPNEIVLYPANSTRALDPCFTQLYGNNGEFSGGGGGGFEAA